MELEVVIQGQVAGGRYHDDLEKSSCPDAIYFVGHFSDKHTAKYSQSTGTNEY